MSDHSRRTPSRVVGVFAHPDDEIFCAGGTMAKWAAEGADVFVVCATRGEAGQIRDSTTAVRRTLGEVREAELREACARLGVEQVVVLNYHDGTLQHVDLDELATAIEQVLADIDPDVVITFGEDGAYGHPDHIAVGAATTLAVGHVCRVDRESGTPSPQLLKSHFPTNRLSLAERLAGWLTAMEERFGGSTDYARALTLFAEESTTMRFASDEVEIVWYPHGTVIVEQGEPATSLCLILSGSVEVFQEDDESRRVIRTLTEGQFFGELGVVAHQPRSASVAATGNVTCLVLSPSHATKYDGRGAGSQQFATAPTDGRADLEPYGDRDALRIDVRDTLDKKLSALAAHRSQYPIDTDTLPRSMLEEMYGTEYFLPVNPKGTSGGANATAARSAISVDNAEIRVTTWTFDGRGAATGRHRHEFDYLVVPVTGGTFVVTDADGSVREMRQTAGSPYLGVAGTTHDVASTPGHEAVFVEIELKR